MEKHKSSIAAARQRQNHEGSGPEPGGVHLQKVLSHKRLNCMISEHTKNKENPVC